MTGPRFLKYRTAEHNQQLYSSGLTDETIELAEIESEKDAKVIRKWINWYPDDHEFGWCLAFPCKLPGHGEPHAHRIRPDNPRPKDKKKKKGGVVKYESPARGDLIVYFGPRARGDGRLKGTTAKVWTEGEKKALLLEQLGYAVIGLTGVDCWHDVAIRNPPGKDPKSGPLVLHPHIRDHVTVEGCDHIIAFDSDAATKKGVLDAARKLARALYEAGALSVALELPPQVGAEGDSEGGNAPKTGIDDYYMSVESAGEGGTAAIAKLFARRNVLDRNDLGKPEIILGTDEHRVTDEASALLGFAPELYKREHQLVRVVFTERTEVHHGVRRAAGTPQIRTIAPATLSEILSREARVLKCDGEGDPLPAHPPRWLVDQLIARAVWPKIRELVTVLDSPVLRPDGTVLATSGYDAATRVLLQLEPSLERLVVPQQLTQQDARAAADELLELFCDFPFSSDGDRAALLACILTPFARLAYAGPTPLGLFDASTRGSGKSKIAKVVGIIATGRVPGEAGYVHDSIEMGKRITSIALQGDRVVLLDNIVGAFGNEAMNRALTSTDWKDRLLGKNESPTLPLLALWLATGNNVDVRDDMIRRIILIRLVAMVERPEERTGFAIANLEQHTREHRARYVRASLIMLRAFVLAGKPTEGLSTLGSFEGWRDLVGGAVLYGYGVDPMQSRRSAKMVAQDEDLEALRCFVRALREDRDSQVGLLARDILDRLGLDESGNPRYVVERSYIGNGAAVHKRAEPEGAWREVRDCLDVLVRKRDRESSPTARRLGMALRRHIHRAVELATGDGLQLCRLAARSDHNTQRWHVEVIDSATQGVGGTGGTKGMVPPLSHDHDHTRSEDLSLTRKSSDQSPRSPSPTCKPTGGAETTEHSREFRPGERPKAAP